MPLPQTVKEWLMVCERSHINTTLREGVVLAPPALLRPQTSFAALGASILSPSILPNAQELTPLHNHLLSQNVLLSITCYPRIFCLQLPASGNWPGLSSSPSPDTSIITDPFPQLRPLPRHHIRALQEAVVWEYRTVSQTPGSVPDPIFTTTHKSLHSLSTHLLKYCYLSSSVPFIYM